LVTIVSDLLLLNLAFYLAYYARYELEWLLEVIFDEPYSSWVLQHVLFVVVVALIFSQTQVWQRRRGEFWIDEIARVVYATAAAVALMVSITFFLPSLVYSRLLYIWALLFTILLLSLARIARRIILVLLYNRGIGVDHVVVVGSGEVGRGVIRTLLARPELGFRAIGYLDDNISNGNIGSGRIPHLGTWEDLERMLVRNPLVHTVFIALPATMHRETMLLVRLCQNADVRAQVVPDLFELSLSRVEFSNMAGIPVFSVRDLRISWWGQATKRVLDLAISLVLLLPVSLVIVMLSIAIRLDSPGPALFAQKRVGKNGKLFTMYKLRSMVLGADEQKDSLRSRNEVDGPIFKIRKDPRLTRVGRLIRRLSIDELPQLWNVVLGQMSLVGPRPQLPEEVEEYLPWHEQRLTVRGGITGLWQVSGRSDLTFDEQCLLDIYYIENWSLTLDIRIMLQTIPFALFGRGAY
jgi:exopolysaccharide biosynthesis polyprenyl glycosylphosphotransferase